jgi:eukaryotic-like serine/threonine-protein kinase
MNCPTDDLLISFAAGTLEEVVREPIRAHLETCEDCAARVVWFQEELFQDFDDDLNDDLIDNTDDPTKSLARQDSQKDAANPTVVFDSDDSFDTSLLDPSKDPEYVGWLGKYQVRRIIGTGAMGVVLEAFEESLGRTVAIKLLKRQISTSERARKRFIREARAAAGIIHANVVTIFGVEEQRKSPYLVMEYVPGGTLREYIRKHKRLAPMEVVRLAKGIAEGLAAAHQQGVIHRDIKPGNLLLEEGALRAKITDFGLARVAVDRVDLTSHGLAVGTPAYMSPEQVRGEKKLDYRTDLFSLGCVIYAMVTGRTPFRGASQFEIARQIIEVEPTPLDQVVLGTPGFLVDLTQRLLAKRPEDRFSSATEVADLLEHYLARLNESPTDEISGIMRNVRLQPRPEAPVEEPSEEPSEGPTEGASKGLWEDPTRIALDAPRKRPRLTSRRVFAVAPLVLILALLAVWPFLGRNRVSPPRPSDAQIINVGDLDRRPDCVATITEAISRARPGTTILIHPDKKYIENIVIEAADRLTGLVLAGAPQAANRPVLVGSATNPDSAVITVRNVSGVTIRGLEIQPGGCHGIVIEGDCQNVLVEQVLCAQPPSGGRPAIEVWARATGDHVGPITIRDSTIDSPGAGHCLRMGHPDGLHVVRLEDNRFQGRGVLVLADGMLKNVTICGNQFLRADTDAPEGVTLPGMTVGLNLNIEFPSQVERIVICNNTFYGMEHWLGIVHSVTSEQANVHFANNLILACGNVQGEPEHLPGIADHWNFQSNWWETDQSTSHWNDLWTSLAKIQPKIEILNRIDREHPDFLRPPPGSPLWTSAAGDGEFPGYVGAVKPDSNP